MPDYRDNQCDESLLHAIRYAVFACSFKYCHLLELCKTCCCPLSDIHFAVVRQGVTIQTTRSLVAFSGGGRWRGWTHSVFTIRYTKCGRKWQVVAHEGGRKWGVLLYILYYIHIKYNNFTVERVCKTNVVKTLSTVNKYDMYLTVFISNLQQMWLSS